MAVEKDKKQVMDIAKPGKAAATPTARPIIVGHGSIIKDPMVTDTTETPEPETAVVKTETEAPKPEVTVAPSSSKRVIQPLSATTPASEEQPADQKDETPSDQADQASNDDSSSEEAVVDAVVGQATSRKKLGELSEEEKQRLEVVDRLVAEKTYFVPIGQVARRHRRYAFAALLVVILLAAGAAVYAYTAGLLPFAPRKTTEQSMVTPAPKPATTVKTAPKLTNYTSKELRISFAYPQEWGAVTESVNTTETTERGKRVLLTFAAQPKILMGAKAANWKDTSKDVMRICKQPGFTAYTVEKTALDNGVRVVLDKSDRQVIERLEGGLCGDVRMVGNVKFSKNTSYAGISLEYVDTVKDSFDLAQRIADYKKNYDKYFSASLRDQVTSLTTSISEQ